MLSSSETRTIIECAREFGVKEVYLFGSSLDPSRMACDIDLGVLGLVPERFFDFHGALLMRLPRSVDVVDLSLSNPFTDAIVTEGEKLHG